MLFLSVQFKKWHVCWLFDSGSLIKRETVIVAGFLYETNDESITCFKLQEKKISFS